MGNMKIIALCLLFCTSASVAETNRVEIVTTNIVEAVPWFREVNGQLYNTQLSIKFKAIEVLGYFEIRFPFWA